jgi:hypothetical protein
MVGIFAIASWFLLMSYDPETHATIFALSLLAHFPALNRAFPTLCHEISPSTYYFPIRDCIFLIFAFVTIDLW